MKKVISVTSASHLYGASTLTLDSALKQVESISMDLYSQLIYRAQDVLSQGSFLTHKQASICLRNVLAVNRQRETDPYLDSQYHEKLKKRSEKLDSYLRDHNDGLSTILAVGGWYDGCSDKLYPNNGFSGVSYLIVERNGNRYIEFESTSLCIQSLNKTKQKPPFFYITGDNSNHVYTEEILPPISREVPIVTEQKLLLKRQFRIEILDRELVNSDEYQSLSSNSVLNQKLQEFKDLLTKVKGVSTIKSSLGCSELLNSSDQYFREKYNGYYPQNKPGFAAPTVLRFELLLEDDFSLEINKELQRLIDDLCVDLETSNYFVMSKYVDPDLLMEVSGMMCSDMCPYLIETLEEKFGNDIKSINVVFESIYRSTIAIQLTPDSHMTYAQIVREFEYLKHGNEDDSKNFRVLKIYDGRGTGIFGGSE